FRSGGAHAVEAAAHPAGRGPQVHAGARAGRDADRYVAGDRGHLDPATVAQVDVGRDPAAYGLRVQLPDRAAGQGQVARHRVERDVTVDVAGLEVTGHGFRVHA